jgi:hypothetical protein
MFKDSVLAWRGTHYISIKRIDKLILLKYYVWEKCEFSFVALKLVVYLTNNGISTVHVNWQLKCLRCSDSSVASCVKFRCFCTTFVPRAFVLFNIISNTEHTYNEYAYYLRYTFLPFLGTFAELLKANSSFVMSVRPSPGNNSAPNVRIFMNFDIWVFFENVLRKFSFH